MGALPTIYLNDYDPTRLGVTIESVEGLRGIPAQRWLSTAVAGRVGELLLSGLPTVRPRGVTLRGAILASTQALLESAVDAFKSRLLQGAVELRTSVQPGRILLVRLTDFVEIPFVPQMATPAIRFTADLEALSPAWYDRDPTLVVGPAATRVACPVGSLPVAPVVRIMGAANGPVLTLRAANGDSRGTMTFTVNLAAGDYLEVDMDAKTITKYVSGTASNGLSTLTAGDFLTLSPEDADELASAYPTLETSLGSIMITYARRWA